MREDWHRNRRGIVPGVLILLAGTFPAQPPQSAGSEARLEAALRALRSGEASSAVLLDGVAAALDLGEWHHARGLADAAIQRDPHAPEGHLWNGHALYLMAEAARTESRGGGGLIRATYSDAADAYARARALGHDPYEAGYFEGEARLMAGELDAAAACALRAADARPEASAPWSLLARIALEQGDGVRAARAAAAAVERSPGDPEAARLLVQAWTLAQDVLALRKEAAALLAGHPRATALWRQFLKAVPAVLPVADARQVLEAVRDGAKGSDCLFPYWFLAELEEELAEQPAKALGHAQAYVAQAPDAPEGHWKLGMLSLRMGRLAEARTAFLTANALGGSLEPRFLADGLRRLVAAHVERMEYPEALALQAVVVSLKPEPSDLLDLGVLHRQVGEHARAREIYRSILGSEDATAAERATAWNYLGLLEQGAGDPVAAREAFRQALAVDSGNLDARENLGILAGREGDSAGARRELDQVLEQDPTRHRARYWRAVWSGGSPL